MFEKSAAGQRTPSTGFRLCLRLTQPTLVEQRCSLPRPPPASRTPPSRPHNMGDDGFSASELRKRNLRGGSVPDDQLTCASLHGLAMHMQQGWSASQPAQWIALRAPPLPILTLFACSSAHVLPAMQRLAASRTSCRTGLGVAGFDDRRDCCSGDPGSSLLPVVLGGRWCGATRRGDPVAGTV
jgi:hypothetical protein